MFRNKKGAIDPPLILSMLLCAALIIILIISIFNFAVSAAVRGKPEYIAMDAGSLIDVADAAPESLRAAYQVPFGSDGYPKAGSFLLSKTKGVCVSPHSEDEMFAMVSESAIAGFIGGVVVKGVVHYRKGIWRGIKWLGRRIPGSGIAVKAGKIIGKKVIKPLAGAIKKVGIKIGEKIARTSIIKKISAKLSEKISGLIVKKAAPTFGKKLSGKLGPKISNSVLRSYATGATTGGLEKIWCPLPFGLQWPCGWIVAKAIVLTMFYLDYAWTILPMLTMIRLGQSASNEELEKIECYSTTHKISYAEPANCKTIVEKGPAGAPLIPSCDFEKPVTNFEEEQGRIVSNSDFCYFCPNYYVSQTGADITKLKKDIPLPKILGGGLTLNVGSGVLLIAPIATCRTIAALAPPPPPPPAPPTLLTPSVKHGAICYGLYAGGLLTLLYTKPAWLVNLFTGSNILPRDEYYYMQFPSRIDVEKEYNAETGDSSLRVIHAE